MASSAPSKVERGKYNLDKRTALRKVSVPTSQNVLDQGEYSGSKMHKTRKYYLTVASIEVQSSHPADLAIRKRHQSLKSKDIMTKEKVTEMATMTRPPIHSSGGALGTTDRRYI